MKSIILQFCKLNLYMTIKRRLFQETENSVTTLDYLNSEMENTKAEFFDRYLIITESEAGNNNNNEVVNINNKTNAILKTSSLLGYLIHTSNYIFVFILATMLMIFICTHIYNQ